MTQWIVNIIILEGNRQETGWRETAPVGEPGGSKRELTAGTVYPLKRPPPLHIPFSIHNIKSCPSGLDGGPGRGVACVPGVAVVGGAGKGAPPPVPRKGGPHLSLGRSLRTTPPPPPPPPPPTATNDVVQTLLACLPATSSFLLLLRAVLLHISHHVSQETIGSPTFFSLFFFCLLLPLRASFWIFFRGAPSSQFSGTSCLILFSFFLSFFFTKQQVTAIRKILLIND